MRTILFILSIVLIKTGYPQKFINGDFEATTAVGDQINLNNMQLNKMLTAVKAFGTYGDVDIITSSAYGGSGAQQGHWYVAITGNGTDIISLELTKPLIKGKSYSISFYDRASGGYSANPIQIGLSNNDTVFGSVIYTCDETPQLNQWKQHNFNFKAKENAKYITVQMPGGDLQTWANLDNFNMGPVECSDDLKLIASAQKILKGDSVTLTASLSDGYYWINNETKDTLRGESIIVKPAVTTIYTVVSQDGECPVQRVSATVQVDLPRIQPDTVKHRLEFSRKELNGRKIEIQEKMVASTETIKLFVWDKNEVDGDIVSIYLNGVELKDSLTVNKNRYEIELPLQEGQNLLVVEADNLGRVPPNTAAILIKEGTKTKYCTMVSDFKTSGAVEIIYKGGDVSVK